MTEPILWANEHEIVKQLSLKEDTPQVVREQPSGQSPPMNTILAAEMFMVNETLKMGYLDQRKKGFHCQTLVPTFCAVELLKNTPFQMSISA